MQAASILIPARSGSKRIKDKNIYPLGGIPLLVHTILTSLELGLTTYLSSDSQDYINLGEKYDVRGILRATGAATDEATDRDVILDALQHIDNDVIVYLRPTTPFRSVHLVKEALNLAIQSHEQITGLRSVEEMTESAFKCFTLDKGFLDPIRCEGEIVSDVGNQWVRKTYKANGYVDIAFRETVEKGLGGAWGYRCISFLTPPVVEIDTDFDLDYAQYLLESGRRYSIGKTDD